MRQRRVSSFELRQIFNDLGLAELAANGDLQQWVERDGMARPQAQQPQGTKSRVVWYLNQRGQKVALVHEYRLPDGTLGGSGRPDPERVILDNEIVYC